MYGNGRIPAGVLEPMVRAATSCTPRRRGVEGGGAGHRGDDLRVTDSYRSYDQQVDLAERKGLYSQGGYGAVPGTSNHGWGLAVDIDVTDPATLSWVRANGYRFRLRRGRAARAVALGVPAHPGLTGRVTSGHRGKAGGTAGDSPPRPVQRPGRSEQ